MNTFLQSQEEYSFQSQEFMPSHHSSAKKNSIHNPSSAINCSDHSSELHGAETATIVHPFQLKLLEPVIVIARYVSVKPSRYVNGKATLTADYSKSGNRFH